MPVLDVKWITACVTSAQFVVMVTGAPTGFFRSERGISQGFPLSPLLFMLIIEGLSRISLESKKKGKIKGVKISKKMFITHLVFVDDVLMFGIDSMEEWLC